jgi:hypothetical protein
MTLPTADRLDPSAGVHAPQPRSEAASGAALSDILQALLAGFRSAMRDDMSASIQRINVIVHAAASAIEPCRSPAVR